MVWVKKFAPNIRFSLNIGSPLKSPRPLGEVGVKIKLPWTAEFSPPPLKFGILLFRTEGYPNYFLILYSVNIWVPEKINPAQKVVQIRFFIAN